MVSVKKKILYLFIKKWAFKNSQNSMVTMGMFNILIISITNFIVSNDLILLPVNFSNKLILLTLISFLL